MNEDNLVKETVSRFLRASEVERVYGIKRGTLYNLWKAGLIESAPITIKGASRLRLWSAESIETFLKNQIERVKNA